MITQEEWDKINSIIDEKVEKAKQEAMLLLPEVSANLFMKTAVKMQTIERFKKDHKDLIPHVDILVAEMEKIEANNPGKSYNDILAEAIPIVKQKASIVKKSNFDVQKPIDTKFKGDIGVL